MSEHEPDPPSIFTVRIEDATGGEVNDAQGGGYTVRMISTHDHIPHCPECLALLALRIAGAFHEMVEQALTAREAEEDGEEDRPRRTH